MWKMENFQWLHLAPASGRVMWPPDNRYPRVSYMIAYVRIGARASAFKLQLSVPPMAGLKAIPRGQPDCLRGKGFVLTGTLETLEREACENLIKKYGGKIWKTVPNSKKKKPLYAVVGIEPGSAKMAALAAQGTPQLDEDGLLKLIRGSLPVGERVDEPEVGTARLSDSTCADKMGGTAGVAAAPKRSGGTHLGGPLKKATKVFSCPASAGSNGMERCSFVGSFEDVELHKASCAQYDAQKYWLTDGGKWTATPVQMWSADRESDSTSAPLFIRCAASAPTVHPIRRKGVKTAAVIAEVQAGLGTILPVTSIRGKWAKLHPSAVSPQMTVFEARMDFVEDGYVMMADTSAVTWQQCENTSELGEQSMLPTPGLPKQRCNRCDHTSHFKLGCKAKYKADGRTRISKAKVPAGPLTFIRKAAASNYLGTIQAGVRYPMGT